MKKILKNQEGMALSFVVVTLLVVYIMASIVASIAQTNIKQADAQDKGLQAYYTARSGAEMAFEALFDESNSSTLLADIKNEPGIKKEAKIDFGEKGGADIGLAHVEVLYKKAEVNQEETVEIKSVGDYKGIKRSVVLKIYLELDSDTKKSMPREIVWSR